MKLGYGGKDNRGWIQAAIGEDGAISGFPEIPANGDNKLQGRGRAKRGAQSSPADGYDKAGKEDPGLYDDDIGCPLWAKRYGRCSSRRS